MGGEGTRGRGFRPSGGKQMAEDVSVMVPFSIGIYSPSIAIEWKIGKMKRQDRGINKKPKGSRKSRGLRG